MTDAEYLRLFEEGRHGSNKPAGVLRGIRKCLAATPTLTYDMAQEIADELAGLADSADEPEQYSAKIAALRAIR